MASETRIPNGLALDFVPATGGATDPFLMRDASTGLVTQTSSIPASRISGAGNLTEHYGSDVLSITGGTGAVLDDVTIQVIQATTSTSGYLSSTDWNTFNNKLSTTLSSARLFVGSSGDVATAVDITGDVTISNTGVTAIAAGVIVNADIHASAAIAVNKLAALDASLAVVTDGSGFLTTLAGLTTTELAFVANVTSDIQTQFTTTNQRIVGIQVSAEVLTPGAGQDNYAIVWDQANAQWALSASSGGGTLVGPASSTDNAIARWDGTGGDAVQDSGIIIDDSDNITGVASITVALSGLHLLDTNASHDLIVTVGSDLTADRALTITTGDAARSITLSGDTTLDDWFDQSVKTTADVLFASATLSNAGGLHILDSDSSHDLIITTASNLAADRTLTVNTGDASRTISINASGTLYITGGTDVALADGGTGASLSDPNYDAMFVWDDTAGLSRLAQIGTGLTYDTYTNILSTTGNAHVIEYSGTPLTQRANLNFTNGLTASDNTPDTDVKFGGALTGDTELSGEFKLNLINTGLGVGLTAAQFTSGSKLQVRGNGTTSGNLVLIEDSIGTARLTLLDNGVLTHNALASSTSYTYDFTATVSGEYGTRETGTIIHNVGAANTLIFKKISPTITTNANNQISIGQDIDVTFNGTGSGIKYIGLRILNGGLLLGSNTLSAPTLGATGIQVIKSSTTSVSGLLAQNTTAGTGAFVAFTLANNANSTADVVLTASNFTPTAIRATGMALVNSGAGGISLVASNATGVITFATGGSTSANTKVTIDQNGNISYTQAAQAATNTFQTFTQAAHTSGSPVGLLFTGGAHTTLANAEVTDINFNLARTVQFSGSTTLSEQRAFRIQAPTYSSDTATKTITTAATVSISGAPIAGTNVAITNPYALMVSSGNSLFNGEVSIGLGGESSSKIRMEGGTTSDTIISYNTSDILQLASAGRTDISGGSLTNVGSRVEFNSSLITNGGTGTVTFANIIPTINTSGTFSGVIRGIVYNPTETALSGVTDNYGLLIGGTGLNGIGLLTPTAKLHVRGNGTTTGTLLLLDDSSGTERLKLLDNGNLSLGGASFGTSAAGVFAIKNGTAPTTSPADSIQLYAEDVAASSELKVRDEAGNITTLSPHNFELLGKPSEELAWSYRSERRVGNKIKRINVDMLAVIREVEKIVGRQLVFQDEIVAKIH